MHRSIALFASPWVKRGYVSHGHYDVASVHKLIAHIFGKPYRNDDDRERGAAARHVHVDAGLHAVRRYVPREVHGRLVQPEGDARRHKARRGGTSATPTSSRASGSSWRSDLKGLK